VDKVRCHRVGLWKLLFEPAFDSAVRAIPGLVKASRPFDSARGGLWGTRQPSFDGLHISDGKSEK
jgi:hypothetical protein